MKIVDIADEIVRFSGTSDSVAAVAFWLRASIGALNNATGKTYTISSTTLETTEDIGEEEKAIFKSLYQIHYYDVQIRTNLGAVGTESIIEVSSDGASVKRTNKTELSKTYLQARRDEVANLDKMIAKYQIAKSAPRQVTGDDLETTEHSATLLSRTQLA